MKKRVFSVIAVIVALSMLPVVFADGTKATVTDAWIPFDVWRGTGEVSATLKMSPDFDPMLKIDEFVSLETAGSELDKSNYSVTSDADGKAVLTLKEDYLKTLQNGKAYYFHAEFEKARIGLRLFVVTERVPCDLVFTTNPDEPWDGKSSLSVDIAGNEDISFGIEIFEKLLYDGKEVDPSSYTVGSFGPGVSINLKADYAKSFTAGKHEFTAVFENADVTLVVDTSFAPMNGETVIDYFPGYVHKEANDSGVIKYELNASAARDVLRYSAKLDEFNDYQKKTADIDFDGEVNAVDARLILRYAAKLSGFPVKLRVGQTLRFGYFSDLWQLRPVTESSSDFAVELENRPLETTDVYEPGDHGWSAVCATAYKPGNYTLEVVYVGYTGEVERSVLFDITCEGQFSETELPTSRNTEPTSETPTAVEPSTTRIADVPDPPSETGTAPTTMEPTSAGPPTDPTVYEDLTVNYETAREIFGHPIKACGRSDFVNYTLLMVYPDGDRDSEERYCSVMYYVFTNGLIELRDQDRMDEGVIIPTSGAREYKDRVFYIHLPEFNGDRLSVRYFPTGKSGICYQAYFNRQSDVTEIMDMIISLKV